MSGVREKPGPSAVSSTGSRLEIQTALNNLQASLPIVIESIHARRSLGPTVRTVSRVVYARYWWTDFAHAIDAAS